MKTNERKLEVPQRKIEEMERKRKGKGKGKEREVWEKRACLSLLKLVGKNEN